MVVAIIAILAALLAPALKGARDSAKSAACVSNLRQVCMAARLYGNEYKDCFPPNTQATSYEVPSNYLRIYLNETGIKSVVMTSALVCPSDRYGSDVPSAWNNVALRMYMPEKTYGFSYGQNYYMSGSAPDGGSAYMTFSEVPNPSAACLYCDNEGHWQASSGILAQPERPTWLGQRHRGLLNVAYVDGHAGSVDLDWAIGQSQWSSFWSRKPNP